jgi:outer membrane lipoprotein SlyB
MKFNLMVINLLLIGAAMTCFPSTGVCGQSVTIQYGTVEHVETVSKDASHAGGALAGGVVGALLGRRHRLAKVAVGAAAGAAIQGAATSGTLQQYAVKMNYGGDIRISTEQTDIRTGDCVVVEQGEHANIRRVSSIHCEPPGTKTAPQHHQDAAGTCQVAKKELAAAETDETVKLAAQKVRILCED